MSCPAAATQPWSSAPHLKSGTPATARRACLVVVLLALLCPTSSTPTFGAYTLQLRPFFPQTWQELLRNYYSQWGATSDTEDSNDFATYAKRRGENSVDLGERMRDYSFGLGKRGPDYSFGLGKRPMNEYSFGLGKRGREFSFGLGKRAKDYAFGLGKRSKSFSFGLGKRDVDSDSEDRRQDSYSPQKIQAQQSVDSTVDSSSSWSESQNKLKSREKREIDFNDEYENDESTDLGSVNKRRNEFGFGLGKRNKASGSGNRGRVFNFGLGKREASIFDEYSKRAPNHYSFGLGKRGRPFSFGIGKRLPPQYSFGIGKRPDGEDESSVEYHSPYSLLKYFGFTPAPASTSLRFGRRSYDFGLGKRSTEISNNAQKKDSDKYSFGLGKRAGSLDGFQDYDYGNNRNAFSFGLGKRFIAGQQDIQNDPEENLEENAD